MYRKKKLGVPLWGTLKKGKIFHGNFPKFGIATGNKQCISQENPLKLLRTTKGFLKAASQRTSLVPQLKPIKEYPVKKEKPKKYL